MGNKRGPIKMKLIWSPPHEGEYSARDSHYSANTTGQSNWN